MNKGKLSTKELERESDRLEFLLRGVFGDEMFSDEEFPEAAALSEIGAILDAQDTQTGTLLSIIAAKQHEQTENRLAAARARAARKKGQKRVLECDETRKRAEEAARELRKLSDAMEDRDSVLRAETAEINAHNERVMPFSPSSSSLSVVENQKSNLPPVTHSDIVELASSLEKIKREADELCDAVRSFDDLPPDMNLAMLAVEEAKKELAKLDEELRRKVEEVFE